MPGKYYAVSLKESLLEYKTGDIVFVPQNIVLAYEKRFLIVKSVVLKHLLVLQSVSDAKSIDANAEYFIGSLHDSINKYKGLMDNNKKDAQKCVRYKIMIKQFKLQIGNINKEATKIIKLLKE